MKIKVDEIEIETERIEKAFEKESKVLLTIKKLETEESKKEYNYLLSFVKI